MTSRDQLTLLRLTPADATLMPAWLAMFGKAFNELPTYTEAPPSDAYLRKLLASETFIALAALKTDRVVGGSRRLRAHQVRTGAQRNLHL